MLDNDVCGMAYRLIDGVTNYEEVVTKDIIAEYNDKKQLLSHPTTRKFYRREFYFPSAAVDRTTREQWAKTKLNYDDKSVKGQRLLINMGDIRLEQQIFFFNKKGETRVMILQDAPEEGGKNTQEFVNMRKLVQQTLSVDN